METLEELGARCDHQRRLDRARGHALDQLRIVVDAAQAVVDAAAAGASEIKLAALMRNLTAAHAHLPDAAYAAYPDQEALDAYLATEEGRAVTADAATARAHAHDALPVLTREVA